MFLLKSSHRGDFNEDTQYRIANLKETTKKEKKCSGFEPLKLYCIRNKKPGPEVINFFMLNSGEHELLIYVKMQTIVGILTFISRKNRILGLPEPKKLLS